MCVCVYICGCVSVAVSVARVVVVFAAECVCVFVYFGVDFLVVTAAAGVCTFRCALESYRWHCSQALRPLVAGRVAAGAALEEFITSIWWTAWGKW